MQMDNPPPVHTVNVYMDHIFSSYAFAPSEYENEWKDKKVMFYSDIQLESPPDDFELEAKINSKYIYFNQAMRDRSLRIVNSRLDGTAVALFVNVDSINYAIFVKDRFKPFLTNPGGCVCPNETFEECAKREVMEETGINTNHIKFEPCGSFTRQLPFLGQKYGSTTYFYYAWVQMTYKEFERVIHYSDHEIEKVFAFNTFYLDNLLINSMTDNPTVPYTHQTHMLCSYHAWYNRIKNQNIAWNKFIPPGLDSYLLY